MSALGADVVAPILPSSPAHLVIGIDTIEIARVAESVRRYGERFLARVFTAEERARSAGRSATLAARFAAKEAVAKALGTGIGIVGWRGIEVCNTAEGKPYLILRDEAAVRARQLGITEWHLSLTHSRDLATAVVVGYRSGDPTDAAADK